MADHGPKKVVMRDLPDDELRKIALRKNGKGNATNEAMCAQIELCHRTNWSHGPHNDRERSARDDYNYGNINFQKKFK